eukprot:446148-Pyramimonas_sp.AAC.1
MIDDPADQAIDRESHPRSWTAGFSIVIFGWPYFYLYVCHTPLKFISSPGYLRTVPMRGRGTRCES